MTGVTNLFFELIQISLGNRKEFEHLPSEKEWQMLLDLANKQSLASVLIIGLEKVLSTPGITKPKAIFEWIGIQQIIESQNRLQNDRARQLTALLGANGFRSCILKGQGTALYYDKPELRPCGDIDIWVEGDRDIILRFAKEHGYNIPHIDIKHSDIEFFQDVPVEVHFLPSWMYCPFTNKKLQRIFTEKAERQFTNVDEKLGFAHTTVDFDLVYSMVHIYRHIFSEGIGLRQLIDYYYILQKSSLEQRKEVYESLKDLKMGSFVGGIMWILYTCFGMKQVFLLCPINKKHGEFMLSEIMTAGNFGRFDERAKRIDYNKRFKKGVFQFEKNLRFVSYYPSEVLWSPFWKIWHWCWRKKKGYL